MRLKLFRKLTLSAVATFCLGLVFAVSAGAQIPTDPTNVQILCGATPNCTGGTSAVLAGGLLGVTNPSFSIGENSKVTGELILVVMVPNATAIFTSSIGTPTSHGSWSGSPSTLWGFLGVDASSTAQPDFNAFATDSQQFGGTASKPTSFTVYTVDLGSFNQSSNVSVTLTGTFPAGTYIYAYVQSAQGTTIEAVNSSAVTPSGSTNFVTPEPVSIAMFGTGLLVLGGAIRRRWQQKQK